MLTTTVDGLWVLQVLSGIEVLAPELGLRPHLPSVETSRMAMAQPVAEELRSVGVIGATGVVDDTVLEWLTVLFRRDAALLLCAQTPAPEDRPGRILLARFAQWWVALERSATLVRLSGAGTATTEQSARMVIDAQIARLCGDVSPADFRPATIDHLDLLSAVKDGKRMRAHFIDCSLDSAQVRVLTLAADGSRSAQVSVIATQHGVANVAGGVHIGSGTVTIIDTPAGRLVVEHVDHNGRSWMVASPGTTSNISAALLGLLRHLPARHDWFSQRKVV